MSLDRDQEAQNVTAFAAGLVAGALGSVGRDQILKVTMQDVERTDDWTWLLSCITESGITFEVTVQGTGWRDA